MWSSSTGEELAEFKGHTGPVFCCALAHTLNMVVSGSKDKTVKVDITSSNCNFELLFNHRYGMLATKS